MIYHIAKSGDWNKAKKNGCNAIDTLKSEGFIHCSFLKQILKVANNHFKNQNDLVILGIDDSRLKSKIVIEDLYGNNENYPHIYGEINLESISKIINFKKNRKGN